MDGAEDEGQAFEQPDRIASSPAAARLAFWKWLGRWGLTVLQLSGEGGAGR